MAHSYHEGPEAFFYDGCEECTERAADPIEGLLTLDGERFRALWAKMRAVEYERGSKASYASRNEARVGKHLYYISLLAQRHPGVIA